MTRELQEALEDISRIRGQIARSADFKGYGFASVAASAFVAVAAAGLQALLISDPAGQFSAFVGIWTGAAALSVLLVAAEMVWRARRHHSGMAWDLVRAAAGQLLPAGAAGALLTLVLMPASPEIYVLIPSLWQVIFSLSLFASTRSLPLGAQGAAIWYLSAGLVNLSWLSAGAALSPWTMGIPFGVGQALLAFALRPRGAKP